jgi:negative elongation factor A
VSNTQQQQQQQQQPQQNFKVMMSPNVNMKGKAVILANPNILNQKGVVLRTVVPSGNTEYQKISRLTNLNGHTIIKQSGGGPPSLIKTNEQQNTKSMPALIPTNQNIPSLKPVMIQTSSGQQQKGIPTLIKNVSGMQQQQQHTLPQQTILRPLTVNVQGMNMMPQVKLIQRPGQQAQLVQTVTQQPQQQQQQTTQRIIMTQQPLQQHQHIQIQQVPQHQVPQHQAQTIQIQQMQPVVVQQTQQQATQRRELSLSVKKIVLWVLGNLKIGVFLFHKFQNKHVIEAHDMFKLANLVTRLENALMLVPQSGQCCCYRKLNESKVSNQFIKTKMIVYVKKNCFLLFFQEKAFKVPQNMQSSLFSKHKIEEKNYKKIVEIRTMRLKFLLKKTELFFMIFCGQIENRNLKFKKKYKNNF